jgi:hypothetical protein
MCRASPLDHKLCNEAGETHSHKTSSAEDRTEQAAGRPRLCAILKPPPRRHVHSRDLAHRQMI